MSRYKTLKTGYKFDRWIFIAYQWIILLSLFGLLYYNNFDMNYYNCGDPDGCLNPFYEATTWENSEYVTQGEYGVNYSGQIQVAVGLIILFFFICFGVNHFLYNKGKKMFKKGLCAEEFEED